MGILLSIIIPAYNAADSLSRTLSSLSRIAPAHRAEVEVIAVNDGSSDNTLAILQEAANQTQGWLFRLIDKPNGGVSFARNTAMHVAQGKWIVLLDADDELAFDPMPILAADPPGSCLGFAVEYRRHNRRLKRAIPPCLTSATWADVLTAENPFPTTSLIIRRDRIQTLFDTRVTFGEDWLFWLQNPAIFSQMQIYPQITAAIIHLHDRNASGDFELAGQNRVRIAEIVGKLLATTLSLKQRNNLRIQRQIGRLQQRQGMDLRSFVLVPCRLSLYGKLWIYAVAAICGIRATPYRQNSKNGGPSV